ncbi:DNA -binding domain-containing protein [Sphingomonas abietis]|uniref:DUF2285 domain-containing protein n=1 Tax=Sphingomonas abietis TaxID=3012344 RepID=A0ABY7NU40_9SPHN|nr:DUF2285 domain-containing protein [Sphingomonas abietis]WBO24300.1 DUF2285 domain-containing protein [Sphingomonas abietis]
MFWDADHDPRVIRARAEPTRTDDRFAFDLLSQPVTATLLIEPGGAQQLLLAEGVRSIRIALNSGTLLEGPVRLHNDLPGDEHLDRRLLALGRWSAFMKLGRFPRRLYPLMRRGRRWNDVVRTANAMARYASAIDVAVDLMGRDIVAADWDHESDYLRARTRRLMNSTRRLAGGGYLDLLTM